MYVFFKSLSVIEVLVKVRNQAMEDHIDLALREIVVPQLLVDAA